MFDIKYKKPVIRLVLEVSALDDKMQEIGGKEMVFDEKQGKEVEQPMGIFGCMLDKTKAEKFTPIWKEFCELVIEKPPEGILDFVKLTGEEVLEIREGFFDVVNPLRKRFAALKPSGGLETEKAA